MMPVILAVIFLAIAAEFSLAMENASLGHCNYGSIPGYWRDSTWQLINTSECQLQPLLHEALCRSEGGLINDTHGINQPIMIIFVGGVADEELLLAIREAHSNTAALKFLNTSHGNIRVSVLMPNPPCTVGERMTEWAHLHVPALLLGRGGGSGEEKPFELGSLIRSAWGEVAVALSLDPDPDWVVLSSNAHLLELQQGTLHNISNSSSSNNSGGGEARDGFVDQWMGKARAEVLSLQVIQTTVLIPSA